ncbi:protein spaetzle [Tribolium castaneum]|uniref:Spaetzle n=1 Tax=Tribolium castaneum TaxID=7070 RepID=D6W9U9_TRICA|nr:PREDICTED: protein spaetzle isoform X1 [Tribolium castaneum]XP_008201188.1 PREDICTED: protein spaetzle isoform X1 [Tribolium castaneum]XP_975083.1 PREDICTED: protein spaetzle isoform X2 [Tribolium castaneum]EEZ99207.1 spaetzle [Tribolium castaneum]|eukprot:XP_008201187.1 PREDICTED: protein spaetzle isoform X1 [Tribolium castaneum]
MNGNVIIVLMSLMSPIAAFTDYYNRPTARPRARPHISDTSNRNQYSEATNETIAHMHLDSRSSNSRQQGEDTPIVYPEKPTCDHGLCYNVAGYPKEQIKKILSRSHDMNRYFETSEEVVNLDNRFNTDEMSLCETTIRTIYPEKANNTQKVEKVIVNVEGHKQGIVFETCVNNGKCKFSSNFPTGYTSYCKQKYIHKRLMVLGDDDKFVFDLFEVPSCCICTVSKTN